jgi:hypothetical protein
VQYAGFRDHIMHLCAVLVLHLAGRRLFHTLTKSVLPESEMLARRVQFDVIAGVAFITALHGVSACKILFILSINYSIKHYLANGKYMPIATWVFNIAILFLNEWFQGYRVGNLAAELAELVGNYVSCLTYRIVLEDSYLDGKCYFILLH